MDESEWLACGDPDMMLRSLQPKGKLTERKARLFACACCRRVWHLLADERLQAAVATAEAHADGEASDEALATALTSALAADDAVYEQMTGHPPAKVVSITVTSPSGEPGVASYLDSEPEWVAPDAPSPLAAAASASRAVHRATTPVRFLPWTAWQLAADAAAGMWRLTDPSPEETAAWLTECAAQADLVRDVFAPPSFRPTALAPSTVTWNDGTVVRLAQAAYEERRMPSGELDPARLAVLADALEDAGCTDDALLTHLRSPGPQVRGCWALDLILGKQ